MECNTINAVIKLNKEGCPERKRTTIVITECGDEVYIGVKAIARVYERGERDLEIHEEQHGDVTSIGKNATIGSVFEIIKELFEKVPEIIDKTNTGCDEA